MIPADAKVRRREEVTAASGKPANVDGLIDAWKQIVSANHDILLQSHENETKEGLGHVRGPPSIFSIEASYDVVFAAKGIAFQPTPTRYGHGTLLHKMSLGALRREGRVNDDGVISIVLGVALRFQALEDTQPFRVAQNAKKKLPDKEHEKANKKMLKKKKSGFDHVMPLGDDGEPAESRRIYWLPDSVLKLVDLDLQLEERLQCMVCNDEVLITAGFMCDNHDGEKHFTCDECFDGYVRSKVDSSSCELRLRRAAKGMVYCPLRRTDRDGGVIGCCGSSPISEADIVAHAPGAFGAFQKNKEELLAITLRAEITEEQRKLFEEEQKRLARMSDQEREIRKHRTHIVENLLTLKCPRSNCGAAFVDFDGCFALKCGRCNCGFCGWCLKDCGDDAHDHVARCTKKVSTDEYHGSFTEFEQAHKPRRERLVRDYLHSIADHKVRTETVAQSRIDLEDLDMHALVAEFGAAAEAPAAGGAAAEEHDHARADEQLALALQAAEDEEMEEGEEEFEGGDEDDFGHDLGFD